MTSARAESLKGIPRILQKTGMRVAFGRFTFDSDTRELLEGGRRVHVSPKAFDLLRLLLERRPNVVSKAELHERVWPGRLRRRRQPQRRGRGDPAGAGRGLAGGRFIRTVHRVGYAFSGTSAELERAAGDRRRGGHRCWLVWNDQTLPAGGGRERRRPRSAVRRCGWTRPGSRGATRASS